MERRPLSFALNITVSGAKGITGSKDGSGSSDTPSNCAIADAGGYIRQIIVKPSQESATYSIRIENSNDHVVLRRTEQAGDLSEDVATPVPKDTYTVYIYDASHNGTYEVEIIYAEIY